MSSARRNRYDVDGYVPASSRERIAGSGDKDAKWGDAKTMDTSELNDTDLELGKGYMTTRIRGGAQDNVNAVGLAMEDERTDLGKERQIVKTVHINQYASDP